MSDQVIQSPPKERCKWCLRLKVCPSKCYGLQKVHPRRWWMVSGHEKVCPPTWKGELQKFALQRIKLYKLRPMDDGEGHEHEKVRHGGEKSPRWRSTSLTKVCPRWKGFEVHAINKVRLGGIKKKGPMQGKVRHSHEESNVRPMLQMKSSKVLGDGWTWWMSEQRNFRSYQFIFVRNCPKLLTLLPHAT